MKKKPLFCTCCGETHSALLAKLIKPQKGCLCQSCLHGSLHNGGICPAADEHRRVRFSRIGHFVFTNVHGIEQSISVGSSKAYNKEATPEL